MILRNESHQSSKTAESAFEDFVSFLVLQSSRRVRESLLLHFHLVLLLVVWQLVFSSFRCPRLVCDCGISRQYALIFWACSGHFSNLRRTDALLTKCPHFTCDLTQYVVYQISNCNLNSCTLNPKSFIDRNQFISHKAILVGRKKSQISIHRLFPFEANAVCGTCQLRRRSKVLYRSARQISMCGSRGGTHPGKLQKMGTSAILVRIPLNHKATNPAFNVGPSSARQRNAIYMEFRWRAVDGVVFGSFFPHQTKKRKKGCQSWTPSGKTFGIRAWISVYFDDLLLFLCYRQLVVLWLFLYLGNATITYHKHG